MGFIIPANGSELSEEELRWFKENSVLDRKKKLDLILKAINECCESDTHLYVSKKKLVAECSKMWGSKEETIREYIHVLVESGEIFMQGDDIYSMDRYNKILLARSKDQPNKTTINDY